MWNFLKTGLLVVLVVLVVRTVDRVNILTDGAAQVPFPLVPTPRIEVQTRGDDNPVEQPRMEQPTLAVQPTEAPVMPTAEPTVASMVMATAEMAPTAEMPAEVVLTQEQLDGAVERGRECGAPCGWPDPEPTPIPTVVVTEQDYSIKTVSDPVKGVLHCLYTPAGDRRICSTVSFSPEDARFLAGALKTGLMPGELVPEGER